MPETSALAVSRRATFPLYVCAGDRLKLIGTIDGRFPDFGHHLEKEMGGLWLHPIKVLDGFWLRLRDLDSEAVDVWTIADEFENRPEGNVFRYGGNLGHTPIRLTRTQVVPETGWSGASGAALLVDYEFFNPSAGPRNLELEFLARTDLRPVWLSEGQGIRDQEDEGIWLEAEKLALVKDGGNEWYAAIGSLPEPNTVRIGRKDSPDTGPERGAGKGIGVSLNYGLILGSGERKLLRIILAASCDSREDCLGAYRSLSAGRDFLGEKQRRYAKILERSRLVLEDRDFQTVYDWVKVNTDWLVMDTVHGRALGAGLPEYPWWFGCDNSYALQGVLAMGDYDLCRDTLRLLLDYSEKNNGNGRIIHEVTTAGICAHPGNTQETAHFVSMMWRYYQWTGDFVFVDQSFPSLRKSVEWLRAQDREGDGFPEGYGIIEIPGLNSRMLDTAVYAAEAYGCFAGICSLKGLDAEADEYRELSRRIIDGINRLWWNEEEGLYSDTYTSAADVMSRREAILGRRFGLDAETGRQALDAALAKKAALDPGAASGWLLNYAWIINTPLETGIVPADRAARSLEILHSSRFIGPYGMYLSGLFQDSAMTISTGVMAVAQARYGYVDRALELLKKMFSAFGMASPGCISEMLPDYGCFVQAWTIYAVMVPITSYFFGVTPRASQNQLRLSPRMPRGWSRAALENLRVMDGELNIAYRRDSGLERYTISYTGDTPLVFEVPPGFRVSSGGHNHPDRESPWDFPAAAGRLEISLASG
jgi:hypothetical protein